MKTRSVKTVFTAALCLGLFLSGMLFGGCGPAEEEPLAFEPNWESLKKRNPAPDWFRDAKFGIYFHWGVYSVPAFGSEWYSRNMHIKRRPEYRHHLKTYGKPSEFGYHDFVPKFTAENFNADEWAELFEKAGARFAGPVAEHHDGFAMWASKLTPWNAKEMGPKRDITGEIAVAIRRRGMRLVTSFHHARNHQHQIRRNGKTVWTGHYPRVQGWPTVSEDPKLQLLYGNIPRDRFLELWKGKLFEVIDNYQPDLIWFDSWLNEIPELYQEEFLAYYFNKAEEWGREVVVTSKQQDLPLEVGVEDFEKGRTDRLTERAWLTDDTISRGSWCYTENLKIKSTREVLHVLIDIVSKNGQLLLNVSPMADGTIPENQKEVLLGIGRWLGRNGEAIYGTRPWRVFGVGPTRLEKGGAFVDVEDGYTPEDVRFTRKGNTVYAVLLGWPGVFKEIVLESFAREKLKGDFEVTGVSMLGSVEGIPWKMREDGLAVTTPGRKVDDIAVVFRIETTGEGAAAER